MTTAGSLRSRLGEALIGRSIVTEPFGGWPGGVATIREVGPCSDAPEIVFWVESHEHGEIGVFGFEEVDLLPSGRP